MGLDEIVNWRSLLELEHQWCGRDCAQNATWFDQNRFNWILILHIEKIGIGNGGTLQSLILVIEW